MSIVAQGLVKSYSGRRVVDGVDISVERGEIVGLLGPNGAGKTTSFYMILGLVRAEQGQVLLDGEDLAAVPMHQRCRRGMGYLAQEPSVFRKLSVRDNLMLILELQPMTGTERNARAPVSRSMARWAISASASFVNSSLAFSISKNFWYCRTIALRGSP